MRTTVVWVAWCLVGVIGCKGGAGSKQDEAPGGEGGPAAAPAAPAAAAPVDPPPPPAEPAAAAGPAKVTAEVKKGDGPPAAVVRVEVGGKVHELVLTADFDGCESSEAMVDPIEGIGDDRLRMAQLFCERGEDYFSRDMITALVLVGPSPKVLWQGQGRFSASWGECDDADVLHFRRGAGGKVEAVRTTGCDEADETQTVAATIDVPAP